MTLWIRSQTFALASAPLLSVQDAWKLSFDSWAPLAASDASTQTCSVTLCFRFVNKETFRQTPQQLVLPGPSSAHHDRVRVALSVLQRLCAARDQYLKASSAFFIYSAVIFVSSFNVLNHDGDLSLSSGSVLYCSCSLINQKSCKVCSSLCSQSAECDFVNSVIAPLCKV